MCVGMTRRLVGVGRAILPMASKAAQGLVEWSRSRYIWLRNRSPKWNINIPADRSAAATGGGSDRWRSRQDAKSWKLSRRPRSRREDAEALIRKARSTSRSCRAGARLQEQGVQPCSMAFDSGRRRSTPAVEGGDGRREHGHRAPPTTAISASRQDHEPRSLDVAFARSFGQAGDRSQSPIRSRQEGKGWAE